MYGMITYNNTPIVPVDVGVRVAVDYVDGVVGYVVGVVVWIS